jgi:hypothetical protein
MKRIVLTNCWYEAEHVIEVGAESDIAPSRAMGCTYSQLLIRLDKDCQDNAWELDR